jgi:hypothetical protein
MAIIYLTGDSIATVADDLRDALNELGPWRLVRAPGRMVYAARKLDGELMHNRIFAMRGIAVPDGKAIRHLDGNGLHNVDANLELVVGKSKFRGVSFDRDKQKWKARATLYHKTCHLGYFSTAREAAVAYDKFVMANRLRAKTNFTYSTPASARQVNDSPQ